MGRQFQGQPSQPHTATANAGRSRAIAYGMHGRQQLDVYRPKGRTPRAVIVFFYGGGWTTGNRRLYPLIGSAFTGRGYAMVVPDYRLFPPARFPTFVEDAALAVKWVRDNAPLFGGAPVFLMGHSAGAHSGALLSLEARYLATHGIEPGFIRGFIGLAGPYTLNPAKWPVVREIFATADPADAARPIKLVREKVAPMLLLHGTKDRVVGEHASRFFAEALKGVGNDAEVKIYPSLGHFEILFALAWGWRWRATVLNDVDAFVTRVLAAPMGHT